MINLKSIADKLDHAGVDISDFLRYFGDVDALNSHLDQLLEDQKRRASND